MGGIDQQIADPLAWSTAGLKRRRGFLHAVIAIPSLPGTIACSQPHIVCRSSCNPFDDSRPFGEGFQAGADLERVGEAI